MFKFLSLLVLHALSHLVAVLLLHTYSMSLPVTHTMVLEYLRVSAVLYYYRLAGTVSWAYMGGGGAALGGCGGSRCWVSVCYWCSIQC